MNVGIDIEIEKIRSELSSSLWTDKNCEFYGRIYPNQKDDGIIPEVYDTTINDYKEVLLDDRLDCISFFYVNPNRTTDFADISIIFAINVKNIYSAYSTRETERAMRDAEKVIRDVGIGINKPEIITGIEAISEFEFSNQNKMDMHPFYLFRFDYETSYDFYSPCPIPSNQYILSLSSDDESQGLAFSNPNKTIFNDGESATLYPAPYSGFEFSKWTINGVDETTQNHAITFDGNYAARAFFRLTNSLIQYFLKPNESIFEGAELKDYSNTPVNAELWGYAIRDNIDGLQLGSLLNDIELDFATDGLKWEFGFSINAASTDTIRLYSGDNNSQVTILKNTYVQQTIFINNDTCRSLAFTALQIDYDDTPLRMKCEVSGTDVTITYTKLEDTNYQNILGTQTKSVTGLLNYANGIGLTNVSSMPYRLSTTVRLRGTMYFMNVGNCKFLLQDKWDSREITTGRIFSNSEFNMIQIDVQDSWIYQNVLVPCVDGYVRYTTAEGRLQFNRPIIGVDDTSNFIDWWNINIQPLAPALDIAYTKYLNGGFSDGWGFTLDAQFEPLDQNNTYFDIGSNANVIIENKQPTKLNSRIYYDRENNQEIKIYNSNVDIIAPINILNENIASIGDSVAGNNWFFLGSIMIGYTPEYFFYGGRTASETQTELETAIISDPTMLSRQKVLIITAGFNDYSKNTSEAQFLIDFRSLVDYVKTNADTNAKIIINAVYIWKLSNGQSDPLDDGNTPNASGLTMNKINEIQKQVAIERDVYLSDLKKAGLINTDLIDIVHPATSSGNLKIINQTISTLNEIKE